MQMGSVRRKDDDMVRQVVCDSDMRNERRLHWQEIDSQLGRQAALWVTRMPPVIQTGEPKHKRAVAVKSR